MTSYFAARSGIRRDVLGADVVVGDLQQIEALAPPPFGLRVEPGVQQRDARLARPAASPPSARGDRLHRDAGVRGGALESVLRDPLHQPGAARILVPAGLERLGRGLDRGVAERVAQREHRVVAALGDDEHGAAPATPPVSCNGASTGLIDAASTWRSVTRTASVSKSAGKHQPVSS